MRTMIDASYTEGLPMSSFGNLNIHWHRVSRANPPATRPANTPASSRSSCSPSSDDTTGSTCHDTTNATLRSILPLCPSPPDDHPPATFRTAQKIRLTAVPNLKISPPTAVLLCCHCRPHPHILPLATPPRLLVSPHLIKRNHRRRLGSRYTSSTLCAPLAHPRPGGSPPF